MSTMTQALPQAKPVEPTKAQIAKGALRRLATERLEPTPENYERAYRLEAGEVVEPPDALATLIERLIRGVERGGRGWTPARRRDGVQRVLAGARSDPRRLQHRLNQLLISWDGDAESASIETSDSDEPPAEFAPPPAVVALVPPAPPVAEARDTALKPRRRSPPRRPHVHRPTPPSGSARRESSPRRCSRRCPIATVPTASSSASSTSSWRLHEAKGRPNRSPTTPMRWRERAHRVLQHRHHLFEQLGKLCRELTASLADLAEDDSWVKGQCEAMRVKIEEGLTRAACGR